MRIGVIGLGRIGAFHARNLAAVEGLELLVTDADAGLTARVGEEVGVATAATPADVIAARPDGVVIAAATPAHPELIIAAVEAGIPTFCEKPVAGDPLAAVELRDRLAGSDVPVQIGYPRRFDPGFVACREAVAAGDLGRLTTIRSTTMDPAPPPAAYLASSGGIFRDCAIHDFDAVRWASGQEVVSVHAVGSVDPDAPEEMYAAHGDVTSASVLLTLDGGTIGVVSVTRTNGRGYDVRLECHGVRDSIAAGVDEGWPMRSAEPGVTFPSGTPHGFFMDRLAGAFDRELRTFVDVAAGRVASPCTIADALETTWVAEAATLSFAEGRPVALDEVRR